MDTPHGVLFEMSVLYVHVHVWLFPQSHTLSKELNCKSHCKLPATQYAQYFALFSVQSYKFHIFLIYVRSIGTAGVQKVSKIVCPAPRGFETLTNVAKAFFNITNSQLAICFRMQMWAWSLKKHGSQWLHVHASDWQLHPGKNYSPILEGFLPWAGKVRWLLRKTTGL